ncbi:hypothetical protein PP764_gp20 [Escherichia phage phi G17]|uniref:Uncharacterized protein n=1 Tax=Escherichia phage phi G17 TaxID=2234086 RepID=A0A2Z4PZT9_9CAUD|nr:hypothetical protein PP764_gp20 [Escherichia phage phi G17]AWY03386.1 hypothetical protein [Escherichia phage phi G17]
MQIVLNQSEVEAAIEAYVNEQVNLAGDISILVNSDGTASVGINEEVGHDDDTPPVVEKKTRRPRKNPQEAKHRPVDSTPEPEVGEQVVTESVKEGAPLELKVDAPTSVGGQNESSTPEPEEEVAEEEEATTEPDAHEEAVQEEVKVEEPAEKPAAKPSLFAGLKRS